MKNKFNEKILAIVFGPLAFFDRKLVLLGVVSLIPEAALLYAGLALGNPKYMAIAPFVVGYHVLLAFPEKWQHLLPDTWSDRAAISRPASLTLGFFLWMAISSPLWWPVIAAYLKIFALANSIEK